MDFSLYWFMFPIAIIVSTSAMLSGIAGAAIFMPIFLLLFPLLGPEYTLANPVVSIAAALITSTFGFTSGFIGYYKTKLIDFKQAKRFIVLSVPFAFLGALVSPLVDGDLIKGLYGSLMLGLACLFLLQKNSLSESEPNKIEKNVNSNNNRTLTSSDGAIYNYKLYKARIIATSAGGFLTGMLSTGIGEVVMPQLVKDGKFPVPVAAATSVLVVISTFVVASLTHVVTLVSADGFDAVPWHLICYTVPGVIIGGQIGPRLQGKFSRQKMIYGISILFILIGVSMIITYLTTLF